MSQPSSTSTSSKGEIVEKVRAVAEPLVAGEGCELIEVEWLREGASFILRLFVDKQGGVGLDECQAVSRALETALDVEDFITPAYTLEVSSPGLNRPLAKPAHFTKAIGQKVKIKTYAPIGDPPRKHFSGVLVGFAADAAQVEIEGAGTLSVPVKDIAKAHIEFDFAQDLKKK